MMKTEQNEKLINELKSRKSYKTAVTGINNYEFINVPVDEVFLFGEKINIETYNLPQDKEYELTNVNDSDTLKLVNERL